MARKPLEIKAISYVHKLNEKGEDVLVETSQLNAREKQKLALWLQCTLYNSTHPGHHMMPTDPVMAAELGLDKHCLGPDAKWYDRTADGELHERPSH